MSQVDERLLALEQELDRLRVIEVPLWDGATSFTPTYDGVTPGVTTYTTQVGKYIRIGNLIIVAINMTWTNATGTGSIRIGGLPFTSDSTTGLFASFQPRTNNVTFANGSIDGVMQNNQTVAQLFSPITNGASTELTVEVAGTITATIIYFTA